jgi:predicted nucleic acid-binding protein
LSVYIDTSFLVSLYLPDRYSSRAEQRIALKPQVWLTPLHYAEWTHAVAQHVFRKEISASQARQAHEELDRDRRSGIWHAVDLPETAWACCAGLAHRHGAKLGTRTLDSLHVAAALELGAKTFWTFVERQARLATAEGLSVS